VVPASPVRTEPAPAALPWDDDEWARPTTRSVPAAAVGVAASRTGRHAVVDDPADWFFEDGPSGAEFERPGAGPRERVAADGGLDGLYIGDDEDFVDQTSVVTRNALEWAVVLVGAVLVALVLRALVFQAFYIPSESMESTLLVDDRVLVNKVSYHLHDVHRGDVVVFERPEYEAGEIRDLIKRVIALPGETLEIRGNSVYIDGKRLVEPYVDEGTVMEDHGPIVVPDGHLFMMGDNRDESQDSRWFGPIDQDLVVGRAFVLFWPVNRAGSL
jgi:signal peptidase I